MFHSFTKHDGFFQATKNARVDVAFWVKTRPPWSVRMLFVWSFCRAFKQFRKHLGLVKKFTPPRFALNESNIRRFNPPSYGLSDSSDQKSSPPSRRWNDSKTQAFTPQWRHLSNTRSKKVAADWIIQRFNNSIRQVADWKDSKSWKTHAVQPRFPSRDHEQAICFSN